MIAWILDLRLSFAQELGVIVAVGVIVGSAWYVWDWWRAPCAIVPVPVRPVTVRTFPPQPSAYLRDLRRPEGPDGLWDASPAGLLRHFSDRAIQAMRTGQSAHGYARMAASIAFRLHPELRGPVQVADSPLGRVLDPAERDGRRRRVVRSINVEVIR